MEFKKINKAWIFCNEKILLRDHCFVRENEACSKNSVFVKTYIRLVSYKNFSEFARNEIFKQKDKLSRNLLQQIHKHIYKK